MGEILPIARGTIVTAWSFRHPAGRHVDPDEELFALPTVILTTGGSWAIAGRTTRGRAGPDTVVVAGPGTRYRCRHDAPSPSDRTLAVTFGSGLGLLGAAVTDQLASPDVLALVPVGGRVAQARTRLAEAIHAAGPLAGLELDLAAVELLVAAARERSLDAPAPARSTAHPAAAGGREGIRRALASMAADPLGPADLSSVAGVAGMSPFHFARMFRREVGESPIAHLRRLRLEHAADRLQRGECTVTDVAHEIGYADAAHFATAFRRAFGRPPSSVRPARRTIAQDRTGAQAG